MKVEPESSGLERIPNTTEKLDPGKALKVMKVIDLFEEDEDVQKVYHNLEIDDEVLAAWQNQS
ncbi:MAG: hypothetical protein U5L09_04965 [Bacteroidales bacterium]|nr:hypothetical protein [Bacteroidales bacterium]